MDNRLEWRCHLKQRTDLSIGGVTDLTLLNVRWIVHSRVIVLKAIYSTSFNLLFLLFFQNGRHEIQIYMARHLLANQDAVNFQTTSAHCARAGGAYFQNNFEWLIPPHQNAPFLCWKANNNFHSFVLVHQPCTSTLNYNNLTTIRQIFGPLMMPRSPYFHSISYELLLSIILLSYINISTPYYYTIFENLVAPIVVQAVTQ